MIKDFCSIGSTWNLKGWLKWAIPALFGMLFLTMLTRCNPIETDLGEKTQSLLGEKGMGWAKTSLDGRDLTLTGEAPNSGARDSAVALAEGVYGVRKVEQDITLKEWYSSKFNLQQKGELIVLSGSMPDQASIDEAVTKAHALYGDTNVSNKLKISDSASAPAWLAGTTGLMATLYSARNVAMDVSDDKVEISAEVETEAEKSQLIAEATASYGDKFSESISVVKTRPTAEEIAAVAAAKLAEEHRIAEAARLAKEAEAARLAEEARLSEEARLAAEAETARLAAEAEAARLAEEARLSEEARLAAKAEAARLAEEARLAKIAAEEQRLAAIEAAKQKAAAAQLALLASCQTDFEQMLSENPAVFKKDSSEIHGESYRLFGMLAQKVNYCSGVLHDKNQYINVSTGIGEGETSPLSASMSQQRIHSAISYLEVISGAHHGLLRPNSEDTSGSSQLNFNISE